MIGSIFRIKGERFNWVRSGRTRKLAVITDLGAAGNLGSAEVQSVGLAPIAVDVTRITCTRIRDLQTEDVKDTGFRDLSRLLDVLFEDEPTLDQDVIVCLFSFVRTDTKGE
jgi:hypothetical protein